MKLTQEWTTWNADLTGIFLNPFFLEGTSPCPADSSALVGVFDIDRECDKCSGLTAAGAVFVPAPGVLFISEAHHPTHSLRE